MYFVVIRYSCDLNPLKPVKYVLCWMIPAFFFLPHLLFSGVFWVFVLFCFVFLSFFLPFSLALAVFKDRYLSWILCIATTEKENKEWGMERKSTHFPIHYWFLWFAEGSCCGFYMKAVGGEDGEDGENGEAHSGTVLPCKFLPIPVFLLGGILERIQAFHVHRELKLRSLTFLKSILSLIFQRFKQKILT